MAKNVHHRLLYAVNLCWLPSSDLVPSQAHIKCMNGQHSSLFTIYDAKTCIAALYVFSFSFIYDFVFSFSQCSCNLALISQIFRRVKILVQACMTLDSIFSSYEMAWDTEFWSRRKKNECVLVTCRNSHWTIRSRPNYPLIAIDVLESIDKCLENASICTCISFTYWHTQKCTCFYTLSAANKYAVTLDRVPLMYSNNHKAKWKLEEEKNFLIFASARSTTIVFCWKSNKIAPSQSL